MNIRRFSGNLRKRGHWLQTDLCGQSLVRKAPASASEATDISEIRFRYRICGGVLSWGAPTGDAGGRPGTDFTASWPPVDGGALRASGHAMAARESQRLGGRNPAARPARRLSRWQERALRARETAEGWAPCRSDRCCREFVRPWTSAGGHPSMISPVRQLAPYVYLPLRQLALCLDCDECFEISSPDSSQRRVQPSSGLGGSQRSASSISTVSL
jgi:hypothetical protein